MKTFREEGSRHVQDVVILWCPTISPMSYLRFLRYKKAELFLCVEGLTIGARKTLAAKRVRPTIILTGRMMLRMDELLLGAG